MPQRNGEILINREQFSMCAHCQYLVTFSTQASHAAEILWLLFIHPLLAVVRLKREYLQNEMCHKQIENKAFFNHEGFPYSSPHNLANCDPRTAEITWLMLNHPGLDGRPSDRKCPALLYVYLVLSVCSF